MSNKYLIVFFLLAASLKGRAQSCKKTGHGLTAAAGGIRVEVQFLSPEVIRVLKYPAGTSNHKNSFSVVQQPGNTWFTLTRENGNPVLRSKALTVRLDLHTGTLRYYTPGNRLLLAEKDGGARLDPAEWTRTKGRDLPMV
jgi:alpha-D-xyloside xylohydrolase